MEARGRPLGGEDAPAVVCRHVWARPVASLLDDAPCRAVRADGGHGALPFAGVARQRDAGTHFELDCTWAQLAGRLRDAKQESVDRARTAILESVPAAGGVQ